MNVCTCGRAFSHCRFCGSKNLYKQKARSLNRTIELGKPIEVHSCKRCGADTDETLVCRAPSFESRTSSFVAEEPAPRPQPGTEAYMEASKLRLNELLFTKLTIEQAVMRMQSEGWVIEIDTPKAQVEQITPESVPTQPVPLEKVLEIMKEQADREGSKTIDLAQILENMKKRKTGTE